MKRQRRSSSRVIAGSLLGFLGIWVILLHNQHQSLVEMSKEPTSLPTIKRETNVTFDGFPLTLHESHPPPTTYECTQSPHWMFRSCQYSTLCFHEGEYFAIENEAPQVSLGSLNARWLVDTSILPSNPRLSPHSPELHNVSRIAWSPPVRPAPSRFYSLNQTMLIFSSMAAHNIGHMMWDDLYPIFRLQQLYRTTAAVALHHPVVLYATCFLRRKLRLQCKANLDQWHTRSIAVDKRLEVTPFPVCFRALAGLGALSDHGVSDHGWEGLQYPHNVGHAREFYDFVQFQQEPAPSRALPRIVFSIESSKDEDRRLLFTEHRQALEKALSPNQATIESLHMWNITNQRAFRTDILITVNGGGGALPVTFLDRGSTMIVFYSNVGYDYANQELEERPTMLDGDLLNHGAAHAAVHWMPIRTDEASLQLFVQLVLHELDRKA